MTPPPVIAEAVADERSDEHGQTNHEQAPPMVGSSIVGEHRQRPPEEGDERSETERESLPDLSRTDHKRRHRRADADTYCHPADPPPRTSHNHNQHPLPAELLGISAIVPGAPGTLRSIWQSAARPRRTKRVRNARTWLGPRPVRTQASEIVDPRPS